MTATVSPPVVRRLLAWTGFVAGVVLAIVRWSVRGVGIESAASYWVAPGVLVLTGLLLTLLKPSRGFGAAFVAGVLAVVGVEFAFLLFLSWLHTL